MWGADIDGLVLRGAGKSTKASCREKWRGKDENLVATFKQYNLENRFVDVVTCDNATPCWRNCPLFDAIVTDPPYGIREKAHVTDVAVAGSSKESEIRDDDIGGLSKNVDADAFSSCAGASTISGGALQRVYCGLLNFASQRLVVGGRLVFWMPVKRLSFVLSTYKYI